MKQIFSIVGIWMCTLGAMAQSETPDSIKTRELNEVVVEATMQRTDAKKSEHSKKAVFGNEFLPLQKKQWKRIRT